MHYMIQIDESQSEELTRVMADAFPGSQAPQPYAINEDGNGTPIRAAARYYTNILQPEYPEAGLLPWNELPQSARMAFGASLASTAGWLCPGLTFDCQISAELTAQLTGTDTAPDTELSLPSI